MPNKKISTFISFNKDDYLVVDVGGKHKLGLAFTQSKLLLEEGVEEDDTSKTIEFERKDVRACLGQNPPPGFEVFKCKLEFYEQTYKDINWGPIHFFIKIKDPREMKYIKEVLDKSYSRLKDKRATGFLPLSRVDLRIPKGKYAGSYNFNTKKGDKITLRPQDLKDRSYLFYVIMHEAGHGVWFRCVPKDIKVKWILLFNKRVTVHETSSARLLSIAKAMVSYETIKDFIKDECDSEDKEVVKEALAYIKRIHKLSPLQLEEIVQTRGKKSILNYWPKLANFGSVSPDTSEYAMESVEEFFAEAFAFYMTGKTLPKDISIGIEKTLKSLIR
jgi:hypothetical protein